MLKILISVLFSAGVALGAEPSKVENPAPFSLAEIDFPIISENKTADFDICKQPVANKPCRFNLSVVGYPADNVVVYKREYAGQLLFLKALKLDGRGTASFDLIFKEGGGYTIVAFLLKGKKPLALVGTMLTVEPAGILKRGFIDEGADSSSSTSSDDKPIWGFNRTPLPPLESDD